MKPIVSEVSAAVVGGAITYVVFDSVTNAAFGVRVAVAASVALVAVVAMWLVRRRRGDAWPSRLRVADRVRANRDVSVTDVTVEKPAPETSIATRISSGGKVDIKGIRIGDGNDVE